MSDFHAIQEDVPFDFGRAAELAETFRSAARFLDEKCGGYPGLRDGALNGWQGRFATEFVDRVRVCMEDGGTIASALRDAADGLDFLAGEARYEQSRREAARRWEQQQDRGLFESIGDNVHDFFAGEDDFPPPPPPRDPPVFRPSSQGPTDRGGAAPATGAH
ncbi:MAG: hypothetical protein ACRD0U_19240 [Acidimicrobiales bacterium]